ncbi:3-phosphoshikimate 1-carboxyvinyltransferase [Changpingibacter yushuensis]|uniref:3-phosphoshikimate 1-carboxyvinyltransferase n=1 Tax=Changpingibacter yushuensis TaxID=2758440 RepID=UPI0015F354F9|nr:3-phosphoshikimate 1-carboxyvinyltransferase [Changpingibacter yushuensis]
MPELWPAPFHPEPLTASVRVPGSKSLTNRYLVLAALGDQPSVIREPLIARDTVLMARALEAMGTSMEFYEHELFIYPAPLHGADVRVGLAGTVMRFLPAVAMIANGSVSFDGDDGARVRPIDPVVTAIKELGVRIDHAVNADGEAVLPVTVHGTGEAMGARLEIDASASSQFVSALLLVAPRLVGGLELRHVGADLPSTPHLEMTVEVLRNAGIEIYSFPKDAGPVRPGHPAVRWLVLPGIPDVGNVEVEPDLSNAGAFLAAGMVTGGTIDIPGWPLATQQPGNSLREIFTKMGADVVVANSKLTLHGPAHITALDMDLHDVGELVPTISAVAAFADGTSYLRNIGHLRGHETDRLAAITTELNRIGGNATVQGDDLVIQPAPLHAGTLATYEDHRMATFAAILGLRVKDIQVENIATTSKTLPQFPQMWSDLIRGVRNVRATIDDQDLTAPAPTADSMPDLHHTNVESAGM